MYTTTHREIYAYYRRLKKIARDKHNCLVVPTLDDVYTQIAYKQSLKQLEKKLPTLPAKYRIVVEMWINGKTLPQIEEKLGLNRANVKTRLHRARKRLRSCLEVDL